MQHLFDGRFGRGCADGCDRLCKRRHRLARRPSCCFSDRVLQGHVPTAVSFDRGERAFLEGFRFGLVCRKAVRELLHHATEDLGWIGRHGHASTGHLHRCDVFANHLFGEGLTDELDTSAIELAKIVLRVDDVKPFEFFDERNSRVDHQIAFAWCEGFNRSDCVARAERRQELLNRLRWGVRRRCCELFDSKSATAKQTDNADQSRESPPRTKRGASGCSAGHRWGTIG